VRARELVSDVPFTRESIYELPRPAASVDTVVCLEVLEHLGDPEAGLRELARVTQRHVILSVPREPLWRLLNMARGAYLRDWGNTPGHLSHWSRKGFLRWASTVFDVVAVRCPIPWTIVLAKKRDARE